VATVSLLVVAGWVKSRTAGVTFGGLILGNVGRSGFLILRGSPGEMDNVGRRGMVGETG
tara:strand:+ start:876 stop:1052 length:177 start_codon:yes stop_codon:yes gene_type:complete